MFFEIMQVSEFTLPTLGPLLFALIAFFPWAKNNFGDNVSALTLRKHFLLFAHLNMIGTSWRSLWSSVQAHFNKWLDYPTCLDTFASLPEVSSATKSF